MSTRQRSDYIALIPRWYSGFAHFVLIHLFSLLAIAACLYALNDPAWWEWLLIPAFFIFANAFEWWIHRGPMHHPTRFLKFVYQRHTVEHHFVFTHQTMGMRDSRELFYILFPYWFLPLILMLNFPLVVIISLIGGMNLVFLFYASGLAYYLVYEWFHLVHHIPPETRIGRMALVRLVRRHHTLHHDPALMARGNFNVSFPLWDWILGSTLQGGASSATTS